MLYNNIYNVYINIYLYPYFDIYLYKENPELPQISPISIQSIWFILVFPVTFVSPFSDSEIPGSL